MLYCTIVDALRFAQSIAMILLELYRDGFDPEDVEIFNRMYIDPIRRQWRRCRLCICCKRRKKVVHFKVFKDIRVRRE